MKIMKNILRIFSAVVFATVIGNAAIAETYNEKVARWRVEAEQGDANAQFNLGGTYWGGEGGDEDWREAVKWYRKAAEQGHAQAQFNLSNAYSLGLGVDPDSYKAVRWVRKAAEQGHADAQFLLGAAYWDGDGVEKDQRTAVKWYRKAAEQGGANAQYGLGVAYYFGRGVDLDQREAVRWYRKAAEQVDADVQIIFDQYSNGEDGEKIDKNWIRETFTPSWLTTLQTNLGYAYWVGEGVDKDQREGARWYRKAADQGLADAQYVLGVAYNAGEGVEKDQREAVRWFRMAVEQGNAGAQFFLGEAYRTGEGVEKDQREAMRWYRKAAEQGYAKAQNSLGWAYWNGEGVVTDKREAYIWLSIAKANGNETAANVLRRNNWHAYLSKSEIRAANKEAARRMEAIENREAGTVEKPSIRENIALAKPSGGVSTAEKVFENAWRSVVIVTTDDGQGSGVIIRPNVVATNCHVVDDGGEIIVYKSDNRRADTDTPFAATIRRADEEQDFCLLEVSGLWGVPATVRRYDTLKVGEAVYGLGAPKGLDLSLSDGLVSQLREVRGTRLIQTNAAISPGSSGGGLFDSEGNLVGIMTLKIADESVEGIGFAIAADLALE